MPAANADQLVREALEQSSPNAKADQLVREALLPNDAALAKVDQLVREALISLAVYLGTGTTLASSLNPSIYLQPVTFTATVTDTTLAGTPTGIVAFLSDGVFIGTGTLVTQSLGTAAAVITLSNLVVGTHDIVAIYGGDAAYATSTSSTLQQVTAVSAEFSANVLSQVDTWELDNYLLNWPSDAGTPQVWTENTLEQQQAAIVPTPISNGTIGLLYVKLADILTGLGVNLAVPDDFAPYIVWGTLAELLSSDGSAYDPVRAQYCQTRYNEGVELTRILLGGH